MNDTKKLKDQFHAALDEATEIVEQAQKQRARA